MSKADQAALTILRVLTALLASQGPLVVDLTGLGLPEKIVSAAIGLVALVVGAVSLAAGQTAVGVSARLAAEKRAA